MAATRRLPLTLTYPDPNPDPTPNQGSPYVTMLYDGTLTPMVTSVLVGSATEVDGKKVT